MFQQTAEDPGLRRSTLWIDQLAQKAILSEGLSPALHGEARLRVDLSLCSARSHQSGESLCLYLPGMDSLCFQTFLEHLGKAYTDHHLLIVLDGAPSHTSARITLPENVSLLRLPSYSPELNPVERWFQEFRRALSNRIFETVELLQGALTDTLEPYWKDPVRLRRLAGFSWWVEAIESLGHQCS